MSLITILLIVPFISLLSLVYSIKKHIRLGILISLVVLSISIVVISLIIVWFILLIIAFRKNGMALII